MASMSYLLKFIFAVDYHLIFLWKQFAVNPHFCLGKILQVKPPVPSVNLKINISAGLIKQ